MVVYRRLGDAHLAGDRFVPITLAGHPEHLLAARPDPLVVASVLAIRAGRGFGLGDPQHRLPQRRREQLGQVACELPAKDDLAGVDRRQIRDQIRQVVLQEAGGNLEPGVGEDDVELGALADDQAAIRNANVRAGPLSFFRPSPELYIYIYM